MKNELKQFLTSSRIADNYYSFWQKKTKLELYQLMRITGLWIVEKIRISDSLVVDIDICRRLTQMKGMVLDSPGVQLIPGKVCPIDSCGTSPSGMYDYLVTSVV